MKTFTQLEVAWIRRQFVNDVWVRIDDWRSDTMKDLRVLELDINETATPRLELLQAFGRDGFTVFDEKAADSNQKTLVFLTETQRARDLLMGKIWPRLETRFVFSSDPRYYRRGVVLGSSEETLVGDVKTVSYPIQLQPYKYMMPPAIIRIDESGKTIQNLGTATALPRIAVKGTGIAVLEIGEQQMELDLNGLGDSALVIDCEEIEITVDGAKANSRRRQGDFFEVEPGKNQVNFKGAGTITGIKIFADWRCT